MPAVDLQAYVGTAIRSCWQKKWDAVRTNKLCSVRRHLDPWNYSGLSFWWEMALVRLHISHSLLTHCFFMERAPPPFCDDYLAPLTVRHRLVECLSLRDLRRSYLSEYWVGNCSYNLSPVLGEAECGVGGCTISFVEDAGLLHKL